MNARVGVGVVFAPQFFMVAELAAVRAKRRTGAQTTAAASPAVSGSGSASLVRSR